MSNVDPPNSQQLTPARSGFIALIITLGALLVGIFGQQFGWNRLIVEPVPSILTQAQQDFHSGHYLAALQLFKKLANKNNATAQYWMADMIEQGLGVSANSAKAIDLYKKASAQGLEPAELRLGEIYLRGNSVLPDFLKAKTYLEQAAYHGNARAAMLLGHMYRDGIGEPADPRKAYAWLEVASIEGNALAHRERVTPLNKLSAGDQQAAIARAHDILTQIDRIVSRTQPG